MSPSVPPHVPSGPPADRIRKRPWYLILALIVAWTLGATAMSGGCNQVGIYQTDRTQLVENLSHDGNDEQVAKAFERFFTVLDAEKPRVLPFAVASIVLGIAMWIFAGAAMTGRPSARSMLMQVMGAHAALLVAAYVLTARARAAEGDLNATIYQLSMPADVPSDVKKLEPIFARAAHAVPTTATGLRILAYGLVLLALTRSRTRAFYEAAQPTKNADT